MQFIVICPYCHQGGVRASESAIGMSAVCSYCRSCFTVAPDHMTKPTTALPEREARSSRGTALVGP